MVTRTGLKQAVAELAAGIGRKRVRGHALMLAIFVWGIYVFGLAKPGLQDRFGNLKGADFLHFYVLGWIARHHSGSLLYDVARQFELAQQLVPQANGQWYVPVYGPQYSLLFAPFAGLSYGWAAAAWMLCSALIYAICCYAVWRVCRNLRSERSTVAILAIAFPGFFSMIACGQNSALALAAFTAAFFCLRAKRPLIAGVALGLLAYKPQFGLIAAVVFVATLEWRVIVGALITGCGQFAIAAWYYGTSVIGRYVFAVRHLNHYAAYLEPQLARLHSLRGFWQLLVPWSAMATALYVLSAAMVACATLCYWKCEAPLQLRYAVFLLGTALVDPHLTDYDLVILMPALLLIGDWVVSAAPSLQRNLMKILLYAVYALPVFSKLLQFTHVQFAVIAMAALLFLTVSDESTPDIATPKQGRDQLSTV